MGRAVGTSFNLKARRGARTRRVGPTVVVVVLVLRVGYG